MRPTRLTVPVFLAATAANAFEGNLVLTLVMGFITIGFAKLHAYQPRKLP